MKIHITLSWIIFLCISLLFLQPLAAQSDGSLTRDVDDSAVLDIDDEIGLQRIEIPFFDQIALPGDEYATALSWISFAGGIFIIGLTAFWIFLLLRAGIKAFQSDGEEDKLGEAFGQVKSLFIGVGITIAVPIILSVIGGFLGLGNLWNWPAAFRDCPGSGDHTYYFQATLDASDEADPKAFAENLCF